MSTFESVSHSAREIRGEAPVVPLESEPPARLVVDSPILEALARVRVYIQYPAENLRVLPVFGQAALAVSPRVGHVHVTIDDPPWRGTDASGEQLIIAGLPAGRRKVLINANHQTLDQAVVGLVAPVRTTQAGRA